MADHDDEKTPFVTSRGGRYDSEKRIVFQGINYTVSEGIFKKSPKTILNDVS